MKDLARILLDSANCGVYAAPKSTGAVRQGTVACGLAWFELDLAGVVDKAAFLTRCQVVFGFPASFGHNWDALADCLEDLSWRPARGYVAFCRHGREFARRSPGEFAVALEILAAAATYWLKKDKTFIVLLDAATRGGGRLKPFPE